MREFDLKKNKNRERKLNKFLNKNVKEKLQKIQSNINQNSRVFFCELRKIDDDNIITDQLEKANKKANRLKSKKKKIFNSCFLIVNIILVALVFYNFAHEQGGIQPLGTLLSSNPKWRYIFVAIGLYFATVIFNTLKLVILIRHRTGKFKFWTSFKVSSIGKYYDNITPLGSGGQPFEIYHLKKAGYSADTATAIPLAKYMIWQITFVILNLFILIIYSSNYTSSSLVLILAIVGLSINLGLFLFVFFMSITKKFGASLVVGVLKILHKLRIIKNYQTTLVKVLKFVKSYQYCIKSFATRPLTIILEVIVTMCSIISNAMIAYFIYIAFVDVPAISLWQMVCSCCICDLAACFFPMPGGSGAQELSFNSVLGSLFTEGTLFWGILIWRILTYYLHIVQGGIIIIIDILISKKKKDYPSTYNPEISNIEQGS